VLPQLLCDQETRDRLGDGLAAVAANLWARDCQTCGRSLGSGPPALSIDEAPGYAVAGLHHPGCRSPGWNYSSVVGTSGGSYLSWRTTSFLLPARAGRRAVPWPVVLLNPSMEMIILEQSQGTWRPGYDRRFTSLGMVPPGPDLKPDRPLRGVTARLAPDFISMTVGGTIYETNAMPQTIARAKERRLVHLMVTHALDPDEFTIEQLPNLIRSGRVLGGSFIATWNLGEQGLLALRRSSYGGPELLRPAWRNTLPSTCARQSAAHSRQFAHDKIDKLSSHPITEKTLVPSQGVTAPGRVLHRCDY
jgi:hypothetical protein